jgi:hypothetical protein
MATDINNADLNPDVVAILDSMREAMVNISNTQLKIVGRLDSGTAAGSGTGYGSTGGSGSGTVFNPPGAANSFVNLGAIPKRARNDTKKSQPVVIVPASQPPQPAPEKLPDKEPEVLLEDPDNDSADPVVKKIKESIMEAERSTVIFNLDMGKVPLLNKETMSKRATLALTAMAAAKEEHNFPSPEAVEAIDDVLSITKKMEFFGNTTKSYKHPTDPKSGAFCTVPVCYEFRDRAMKQRAENILKDCCGVQSSTPYPAVVRECIKQIVADVKKKIPGQFCPGSYRSEGSHLQSSAETAQKRSGSVMEI